VLRLDHKVDNFLNNYYEIIFIIAKSLQFVVILSERYYMIVIATTVCKKITIRLSSINCILVHINII
jgi:hypothetical protein